MSLRETFFKQVFTLKNLFLLGNFLLLALFLVVLAKDHFREWKPYQERYKELDLERIKKSMDGAGGPARAALEDELRSARRQPIEVRQLIAQDLGRVDRCITCHAGHDAFRNPALGNPFPEHPYAAPRSAIHDKHPFEKYGCTVCHEGQGLATTFVDAGHMPKDAEQKAEWKRRRRWRVVEFWETPMKAGPLVYASCAKCHEAHPAVPGMQILQRGRQLFFEEGCIGCHQVHGEGQTIAPDLGEETAVKPLARIDFGHAVERGLIAEDERTLENWIRLHFTTHPAVLTPGDPEGKLSPDPKRPQPVAPTAMPYFGLAAQDSEALVAYVLSLKREPVPYTYRVPAERQPEPKFASAVQRGRYVFQKYGCVSCHGKNADRGIEVFNKQGGRVPDLVKTAGTFSREELIEKIQKGVNPEEKEDPSGPTPPLYMPGFKEKIVGAEMESLVDYLFSIAEKTEEW